MSPDPKFGWHAYWIGPLLIIGNLVGIPIQAYRDYKQRKRMAKILKDPEIAEMVRLSGIKNDTK